MLMCSSDKKKKKEITPKLGESSWAVAEPGLRPSAQAPPAPLGRGGQKHLANKLRSTVGLPFAIAGPYQDTGNFAILDTIYVLLEFKLCHSGQGIAEEEVARLGVPHTEGVQRPGRI